jgi:hypothetical protein
MYGYVTWFLTLQEEYTLVLENRLVRRLFGPKRNVVMGGWRKLHNDELRVLYSLPSIIKIIKSRTMRWAVHIARMGKKIKGIGYW